MLFIQLISCIEMKVTHLLNYKVLFYHGRKTEYGAIGGFQMFPLMWKHGSQISNGGFDAANSASFCIYAFRTAEQWLGMGAGTLWTNGDPSHWIQLDDSVEESVVQRAKTQSFCWKQHTVEEKAEEFNNVTSERFRSVTRLRSSGECEDCNLSSCH